MLIFTKLIFICYIFQTFSISRNYHNKNRSYFVDRFSNILNINIVNIRITLAIILLTALTGCGGGGGNGSMTAENAPSSISATSSPGAEPITNLSNSTPTWLGGISHHSALYSMGTGHFTAGGMHVVMAGWTSDGTNDDIPVKIYQINNDGTGSDVTVALLGSEVNTSVNYPVVADFNADGVDDLLLAGFHDFPVTDSASVIYLSRPGQPHRRVELAGSAWNHGVFIADIDNNGTPDIVDNEGKYWMNDGKGTFTFIDHNYNINNPYNEWMHGSGVCAGDFNHTGRTQIVITDLQINNELPISDTVIFELDSNFRPMLSHTLPTPIFDKNSTQIELSHDISCRPVDLNSDGLMDLLVFSRPNLHARSTWTDEGIVQVLVNRGNWKFDDMTNTAMMGYPTNVLVSYTPTVTDLNGDGKPDLWLGQFDGTSGRANMAWLNDGNGNFTRSLANTIDQFGSNGPMVPIKFQDGWRFVFSKNINYGAYDVFNTKQIYSFH